MANAVEVKNVTMEFNMSKEKVDSIKEYFIKLVKRELHFEQFLALKEMFPLRSSREMSSALSA